MVINVCSETDTDINKLKSIFELFNLEKNLNLKISKPTTEDEAKKAIHTLFDKLDPKFTTIDKDNDILIDFSQIISDFNLKNYDSNLKKGYGNFQLN